MNILWLAWKDYTHPGYGGAEVVLRELMKRQVAEGHTVTLLTARHGESQATETLDGVHIIRVGTNRYVHSFQALAYYLRHLRGTFDLVIETVNTAPYFSLFFRGKSKGIALYHQLAREIWYFETRKPFSHFGYYVLEPLATRLLALARAPLITVSESTKRDLARFGWHPSRTHIISEGIEIKPVVRLEDVCKYPQPTMLSLGAMRGMKRTTDQLQAFEKAKRRIPRLRLIIAGDTGGQYGETVLQRIERSPFRQDIQCLGRVNNRQKVELMQRCHIITVTSVKEGWGLIVTEAASQGTPAVVYDVDGLRDSVRGGVTGIVTEPTPAALAQGITDILSNQVLYNTLQQNGWEWSKHITFDKSYKDFKQATEAIA